MEAIVILLIGLLVPLLTVWQAKRHEERGRVRLRELWSRSDCRMGMYETLPMSGDPEMRYIDRVGYILGDTSCQFNARSPHMRCAVNPEGPCQGCRHYEAVPD
jgi:hypothetical protein